MERKTLPDYRSKITIRAMSHFWSVRLELAGDLNDRLNIALCEAFHARVFIGGLAVICLSAKQKLGCPNSTRRDLSEGVSFVCSGFGGFITNLKRPGILPLLID